MDIIHALSLGRGTPWGPERSDPARTGTTADNGTVDAAGEAAAAVADPVALSPHARMRLDIARKAEPEPGAKRHRAQDEGALADSLAPEERERLRELHQQDVRVRLADATATDGEVQLRGSPMFEVQFGPLGRAYAVDEGVKFDPPKERSVETLPDPTLPEETRADLSTDSRYTSAYRTAADLASAPGPSEPGAQTDEFG